MTEERVDVREGDILIIHTGYRHFGRDRPCADEIRYIAPQPGPDREFAAGCRTKKIKSIGVDCGSADHSCTISAPSGSAAAWPWTERSGTTTS